VAAAVFTAISVPWYAAMYQRHGQPYLEGFFIGDNFERFAEPERFNERRPFYYYWPPIIGAGLMPWTAFLLLGIGPIRAAWQQRSVPVAVTRLVIWTAMPLAFFSLSYGKQPRYILPILPPLAILIARAITARLASRPSGDWLLRTCGAATGLAILTLAALIARARPLFDAHAHASGTAAVMVGLGAAAVLAATFQWPTRLPAAIAAAGALTIGALQFGVLTRGGVEPVERMAQHVTDPDHPARYWASFDVFNRNLVFYAREKQTQLMSEDEVVQFLSLPDRVLLVIPADALARIERERSIKTRRLAAERYFNPSGIKIRTLLWPDPERDLDHVLLVANQ
jgi:4-amino-4-deoxy-L-arabinose transferase-like glycosyltransferase